MGKHSFVFNLLKIKRAKKTTHKIGILTNLSLKCIPRD